jgi:hypothetical protein
MFSKVPPWASTVFDCKSKMNPDESERMTRNKNTQHDTQLIMYSIPKTEGPKLAIFSS